MRRAQATLGVNAVASGPSGGALHAVDEWVDLNQVRVFAGSLTRVPADWVP